MPLSKKIEEILNSIFPSSKKEDIIVAADSIKKAIDPCVKMVVPFINIKSKNVEWVPIFDVRYVNKPKPRAKYLVYTEHDVYEEIAKGVGFDIFPADVFVQGDGSTIVNKFQVKKYDSFLDRIYFSDDATKNSPHVAVFHKTVVEFANYLGKEHDLNTEVGQYEPKAARRLFT